MQGFDAVLGRRKAIRVDAAMAVVIALAALAAWSGIGRIPARVGTEPVLAATLLAVPNPVGGARKVTGTVVSPEGYPRSDVELILEGTPEDEDTPRSRADGSFTLKDVPAGTSRWLAYSWNTGRTAIFSITPDSPSTVRVVLNLRTAYVMGRVVDAAGKPAPETRVELRVTTASSESFTFEAKQATFSDYFQHYTLPVGDGFVLEARTLPAGDEEPGAWSAKTALTGETRCVVLADLVVSEEAKENNEARQDEKTSAFGRSSSEWERVGGIVQDEDGRPIAGAHVHVSSVLGGEAVPPFVDTDATGRWSVTVLQPQKQVLLEVNHRDYAGSAFDRSATIPKTALLDGTHVTTLRRGLPLQGCVRDAQGRPLADVLVLPHDNYQTYPPFGLASKFSAPVEDEYSVRTAPDGSFALSCLPGGPARLRFLHPDNALGVVELVMTPQMAPLDVVLSKGGTIWGRIVDPAGQPVPGVAIVVDSSWVGGKGEVKLETLTDANGAFEVRRVPTGQGFMTSVNPKGNDYMPMCMKLEAREDPYTLTLYATPTFTGTVVDDATGEPVTEFRVRGGCYEPLYDIVEWDYLTGEETVQSKRGAFSFTVGSFMVEASNTLQFGVGISADGYFPAVSPLKRLGETMEPMIIRLRKGTPITGVVYGPDGKGAGGAEVAWIEPGRRAEVNNGSLNYDATRRPDPIVETDEAGAYMLPPSEETATVLVLHRLGYASVDSAQVLQDGKIVLTPWAKVEGVSYASGTAEEVLVSLRPAQDDRSEPVSWQFICGTDPDGTFALDRVPAMALLAERYVSKRTGGTHAVPVTTEAGAVARVELGVGGRPAVGRIVSDGPSRIEPAFVRAIAASRGNPAARYGAAVEAEGRFRIDSLPPGDYTLDIAVSGPRELFDFDPSDDEKVLVGSRAFTMPDGPADAVENIGEVRVEPFAPPAAGSAAPDFRARTLNGQEFSLEAQRGRYVVLEFWQVDGSNEKVTRVKELWDRFGSSEKVAFVGVNLSNDPKYMARYVRENGMGWPQILSNNPVLALEPFGDCRVKQYPSLWLIGPDGKVIGRDLAAEAVAESLSSAFGG